ncbi:hypothetical protein [Botrimarina sp.]|uniref:hypothetical protein n=1 Tax=Botrimarina sp. TaxID=2795802 RepID=UPI0032EE595D
MPEITTPIMLATGVTLSEVAPPTTIRLFLITTLIGVKTSHKTHAEWCTTTPISPFT